MHYHIHHTEGIILSSRNKGEADKVFSVYTRELGLVRASAQGVRRAHSKLRFALQDLAYAKIDFVHGKEVWRITSATPLSSFPYARKSRENILLMVRVARLVERLCAGEETNANIFSDLIQAFYTLDSEDTSKDTREALELHLVLGILHELGYIGDDGAIASYLTADFDPQLSKDLLAKRKPIVLAINRALRESQL